MLSEPYRHGEIVDWSRKVWSLLWRGSFWLGYSTSFFLFLSAAGQLRDPVTRAFGADGPLPQEIVQATLLVIPAVLFSLLNPVLIFVAKGFNIELQLCWTFWDRYYLARGLVLGIILGASILLAMTCFVGTLGYWKDQPVFGIVTLEEVLATILTAISEEIVFRSYLFSAGSKVVNVPFSLFLSALFFGAAHISTYAGQYHISPALAFVPAFLGGIMFTYAYRIYANLWLAVGLHFGWNYSGGIFGAALQQPLPAIVAIPVSMVGTVILVVVFAAWKLAHERRNRRNA